MNRARFDSICWGLRRLQRRLEHDDRWISKERKREKKKGAWEKQQNGRKHRKGAGS